MPSKKKKAVKKSPKKAPKRKVIKKKKPVARKVVKKTAKKAPRKKASLTKKEKALIIGKITHYFPHVRAAVIKLKAPLAIGETIRIKGHTTDFTQRIVSLQIDRTPITVAKKGQEIGLLVDSRVRQHDVVTKA